MADFCAPKNSQLPPVAPVALTLLQERAERRDARAGADHDDRAFQLLRQAEMLRRLDEDRQPGGIRHAVGQERGGDAVPLPAVRVVAQGVHGEMHLLGVRLEAGRDGVQPGLEFAQQLDELVRA